MVAAWPEPKMKGRVWLDLQNDVTAKDVELAARENFVSVEHVKRYTTLGMATDQGKTSNLPGLALMAAITGKTIEATGTTTYRPPFVPVPLASFAGLRGGQLMNPARRLALEPEHRADGAYFREYGGWLRPAWYGPPRDSVGSARGASGARKCRVVRRIAPWQDRGHRTGCGGVPGLHLLQHHVHPEAGALPLRLHSGGIGHCL